MTTQPEIKLPPLPGKYLRLTCADQLMGAIQDYARAAVLADRAARGDRIAELERSQIIHAGAHTKAAYRASFYTLQGRLPTEQEVFDQGVREGMRRAAPTKERGADDE